MRELKKTKDYAEEIHRILLEDHQTDVPVSQVNHILDIVSRRIVESLDNNRYVKIHPFYFHIRLSAIQKIIDAKYKAKQYLFNSK